MNLYRTEDIQAITDNLDQIIDKSITIRNKELTPSIDEYIQVIDTIKSFIREKKRIIYGGNALNTLICNKNPDDRIYKTNDRKDIEFYTPEPIKDLVELCNLLHQKGFDYIQGGEAMHDETYSIFVNFENVCDITYMSRNIYGNMPTIKLNKILYTHPMWIMVDTLRQYNDPILSYWRLKDKTFFRSNVLQKYYPLELNTKKKYENDLSLLNHKENIFNEISNIDTLIFLGSIAEQYYLTRSKNINHSNLEIMSVNYNQDIKTINTIIKEVLDDEYKNIKINVYRPFFQFRDEYVEFLLDNKPLIKIFNVNKICIPYNNLYINKNRIDKIQLGGFYKPKKQINNLTIKLATFILLFNHILVWRHYEYINRRDKYKEYEYLMSELLKEREQYLNKNTLNVMDDSPYKEFIVKCSGKTVDHGRLARLKKKQNYLKKKFAFRYEPSSAKADYKIPEIIFNNTSGNVSKNENDIRKIFS